MAYDLNTRKEAFNLLLKHYREGKIDKPTHKREHYKIHKETAKIEILSKPFTDAALNYWNQYYITKYILKKYNVCQVDIVKTIRGSKTSTFSLPFAFAYRIIDTYQIYQPFDKAHKFFNNLNPKYILGFHQLPKQGELLIIDKSMKDVMFCNYLGLHAVAPRAEGILIPEEYLNYFEKRFKRIVIMMDNDEAGKRYANLYPDKYEKLFLMSAKDKTDLVLSVGLKRAKKEIFSILNN